MAEITLELIQQLRERTGIGMMDCKKALIEANGDIEKAIELLRKRGASLGAKRAENVTNHGIVHAYIHPGATLGVLIEIACETDFAARTPAMQGLVSDLCLQIAASHPLSIDVQDLDASLIEKEKEIAKEQLKNSGKPSHLIDKIAENKIEKFYETACLLRQPFIKNDKITVKEYLDETIAKIRENIKIKRFVRFQVGA